MKIGPVGAELFYTYGRKDMAKLTVTFRNFVNAHQNGHIIIVLTVIRFIVRISSQMKHQLDATLCRFCFCRVTLHVSGVKHPSSGVFKN